MALALLLLLLLILPGAAAWQLIARHGWEWLSVPATFAVLSLLAYAIDKRQARRGGGRVPEAILLLLDLLGGWPGGFVAQHVLRHKTAKATYQLAFGLVVVVYQAAAAWWLFA